MTIIRIQCSGCSLFEESIDLLHVILPKSRRGGTCIDISSYLLPSKLKWEDSFVYGHCHTYLSLIKDKFLIRVDMEFANAISRGEEIRVEVILKEGMGEERFVCFVLCHNPGTAPHQPSRTKMASQAKKCALLCQSNTVILQYSNDFKLLFKSSTSL